jgi:sigma-54 dependent transcriptional regulator, acetoin dehydrogenase operon transcriptional activator AcoR
VVAGSVRQLESAARRPLPILSRGETGTGKERFARQAASGRTGAFVAVNCAALPEDLAESELFGHADGAFTGARWGLSLRLTAARCPRRNRRNESAVAGGAAAAAGRLAVRPVGGGRWLQADVLLVAATNPDLGQAMSAGRFRGDLFYRLSAIEIAPPPLRARADFAATGVRP